MKQYFQIALLLALVFFMGCGTPIKQGWHNFTAYYNTFYNAKQSYNEGLKNNTRSIPDINPEIPIRVYISPSQAGRDDFATAIEKGASILQNHERSKYVIPAVTLIGKSYFYRGEYFSALEKFRELQSIGSPSDMQKAVFWQGRTYFEMSAYGEGTRFLEGELETIADWDSQYLAGVQTVLAQLYVARENWEAASEFLYRAIPNLDDTHIKARALFLHGQVLERLGRDNDALFVYSRARTFKTRYNVEFNSMRKEAELSRRVRSFDRARDLYRRMERDDKFTEYRIEMQFELARTHQMGGETEEAMAIYREILRDRFLAPAPLTRAKTYHSIAEIYRDNYGNYITAAAYFDSSAAIRVDDLLLPEWFNARKLALSFGEYASVKKEISRLDSLLYLGTLDPEERDSVLVQIQREREIQFEEQRGRERQMRRIITPDEMADNPAAEASEMAEFGFLNSNSPVKLTEASLHFQAIWDDRPLVDNWRRRTEAGGSRFDTMTLTDGSEGLSRDNIAGRGGGATESISFANIPVTEEAQHEMKSDIENLNYRLANVFFLSLNMPDSARVYYNKILESSINKDIIPRTLYSVADIEIFQGNEDAAVGIANRLISEYPASPFTGLIADRLHITFDRPDEEELVLLAARYHSIVDSKKTESPAEKATQLKELAYESAGEGQRSQLLYEAAQAFMKAALEKQDDALIAEWFWEQGEWEAKQRDFQALKNRAVQKIPDPELTEEELNYWVGVRDSTLADPSFSSQFPFDGAYWDSTRAVLNHIEQNYSLAGVMPKVRILQQILNKPYEDDDEMSAENEVQVSSKPGEIVPERLPEERFPVDFPGEAEPPGSETEVYGLTGDVMEEANNGFSIVLYSLSNEDNANVAADELRRDGYRVIISPRFIGDDIFWRVSVGQFLTISDAQEIARELPAPYDAQHFIQKIQPSETDESGH